MVLQNARKNKLLNISANHVAIFSDIKHKDEVHEKYEM
jgi:hypothetical protein